MRRETPKTNKTVMRVVELEAPTSALASWGTSHRMQAYSFWGTVIYIVPLSCL